MPDQDSVTLILHGWGGNKPAHWQEHLYKALTDAGATVHYPKMPEPMAPNLPAWLTTIKAALAAIPDKTKLTVVCHSLGAISWMHLVSESSERLAERVLLVAPPYVIREIPPLDAPPGANTFFPPPMAKDKIAQAADVTTIIASENDDYATYEQSAAYADGLGIEIYKLEGAGHISPYWGYGEWPWIVEYCLRTSELPPLPKPAE